MQTTSTTSQLRENLQDIICAEPVYVQAIGQGQGLDCLTPLCIQTGKFQNLSMQTVFINTFDSLIHILTHADRGSCRDWTVTYLFAWGCNLQFDAVISQREFWLLI
jgi:hypothetical protein